MKVIKFTINQSYYDELKSICEEEDITIKRKINILLTDDIGIPDTKKYIPTDLDNNIKRITLKINEELYKGIMKKCGKFDIRVNKYLPYLIYKYLLTNN